MLKRNLIANYLGQGWSAAIGLAFIPIYISYLSIDAYGLIGFFAVLQAWLSLLDVGMSPAIGREMSRYMAGKRTPEFTLNLLRSFESIIFVVAIIIILITQITSGFIVEHWLKSNSLPSEVIAEAFSIGGLVIGLKIMEGLYRSALMNLEKQIWVNLLNALINTLRHGGAIVVLEFVSPTISAFFLWQGVVSLIAIIIFGIKIYSTLPKVNHTAKFSIIALSSVSKFTSGMIGINILKTLMTQTDKIVLSGIFDLKNYGYYALATTMALSIQLIVAPITQAIYPRLVVLTEKGEAQQLTNTYHLGAQLVTVLTIPFVCLFALFSREIIYIWSNNTDLTVNVAPILSILVVGSFLNSIMWMPYQLQLANGWTSLMVKTNFIAVIILVPAILVIAPMYGAVGAAWIWLVLNVGYAVFVAYFMHQRILKDEIVNWYLNDLLIPIASGMVIPVFAKIFGCIDYLSKSREELFLTFTLMLFISLILSAISSNKIRIHFIRKFFMRNCK